MSFRKKPTLVISGRYSEFMDWLQRRSMHSKDDYRYCSTTEHFAGCHGNAVLFIGAWARSPVYGAAQDYIARNPGVKVDYSLY